MIVVLFQDLATGIADVGDHLAPLVTNSRHTLPHLGGTLRLVRPLPNLIVIHDVRLVAAHHCDRTSRCSERFDSGQHTSHDRILDSGNRTPSFRCLADIGALPVVERVPLDGTHDRRHMASVDG